MLETLWSFSLDDRGVFRHAKEREKHRREVFCQSAAGLAVSSLFPPACLL